ncbi:SPOR domain-containing protein [Vibrio genomosp. F10]|uniref:Cytochrome C biogenesis protein CcdA n=1 Tax=Vibrio genomosp. F10 TaxID=723171 RepID=A0A1B9QX84_9VIBR|nr:SPOR domain-containing protein [Vibrio genomosp. F10]OCH74381.1 cytochrome C biogenesis protein CcdA [Vibrio genomosp. F10]
MKKISIVGLSVLLSACASDTYITDVTSESYREDYKVAEVEKPVVSSEGTAEGIVESNVETNADKVVPTAEKKVVNKTPEAAVAIIPPTAKQVAMNPRYGFTIQVVAVGSQTKVDEFARKLPMDNQQPFWENYKVVNGTKWYTVLYGDYATRGEAKEAIATLPMEFKNLKPFVKSIDSIKNSEFPTLNKLN